MSTDDHSLREHLVFLLNGGGAHLRFDQAFGDLPAHLRGTRPEGLPYTPWRLLEHLRICQRDILDFSTNPNYVELDWPEAYWPKGDGPEGQESWEESLDGFRADLRSMVELVRNPSTNLFARI